MDSIDVICCPDWFIDIVIATLPETDADGSDEPRCNAVSLQAALFQ
jgi:hypothetical protein